MNEEVQPLLSSLNNQREHVMGILEGLSDDALRQPMLPSGWTCLGMVNHLAIDVERFWFRGICAGEPIEIASTEESFDAHWRVDPSVSPTEVFDTYRHEIALANDIIRGKPLSAAPAFWPTDMWPDWKLGDLQAIVLHVIAETACHAGHLDAARELIDGHTWM
jgi:hypothetical protein